ncbi:MAG: hypothetical protein FWF54_03620 [Candidatus Azobacteroides sp.]|nr:hypothetical protein [Candidatus Azobacteroides sp.]
MSSCLMNAFNTGLPNCDIKPGKPSGLLFCTEDVQIPNTADVLSVFKEKVIAENPEDRVFPIYGMKQVDNGYTEPTQGTLAGYGYSEKLADGTIISTFNFPMQICVAKMLAGTDGFRGRVFILCDNGILLCERGSDGNYIGLNVDNVGFQMNTPFGDGQNVAVVKISVNFGSDLRMAKSIFGIKADFGANDLPGLIDLSLTQWTPMTFVVTTTCMGSNLFDGYKTELSTATIWNVTRLDTNTKVTVTSVTPDAVKSAFKLTLSGTIPANTALKVSLAPPSQLDNAGISGYAQADPVIVKAV